MKAHYTQTGQYDYGQLTVPKIKSHAGFKNWADELWKLETANEVCTQRCNWCGGAGVWTATPGKLNIRTGPHAPYILVPFGFQYFFAFFEWSPDSISFLNFYECLAQISNYATGCTPCSLRSHNGTLTIKTYSHKPLQRRILTSHIVLYYVKWILHKRSLIKLCTQEDWWLVALKLTMDFSNLWKHSYRFTQASFHIVQNYVAYRYQQSLPHCRA